MKKSFESLVEKSRYAMVVGIGGGGDVVGAIPTSRYLRWLGIPTILGGLTWERYVNDPEPGPRKMEEIVDIELLSPTVGLANGRTRTTKGVRFTESAVAEVLQEKTVLIDLNQGVKGVVAGLNGAMRKLGVDLFVGIDVGGDVLGSGSERGLHSMLADSMMLSAMANLEVPTVLGVLGCCMDGELTLDEFNRQLAKIASYGGLLGARCLTPEDIEILEKVIPETKTESSLLAVKAARGLTGEVEIRGGRCKVMVTPMSALTFYLDTKIVYEHINKVAKDLASTTSLDEANEILKRANLPSELEFERSFAWKRYLK
ncbi:MAG: DUF1152 domain-containing protein [Candidatus Hadarchaeum sp.]|uniref:DUF1152 domain-containing protein n=1 Tax=Candidatus Hadarchaeum sp. TaxID=2883567 RepID=UPI003D09C7D9